MHLGVLWQARVLVCVAHVLQSAAGVQNTSAKCVFAAARQLHHCVCIPCGADQTWPQNKLPANVIVLRVVATTIKLAAVATSSGNKG